MIRLNIHEAKTHLSRYLAKLKPGERILLCRRNVPIAEIRALKPARTEKRPVGVDRGRITISPAFFEPLPEDLLRLFEGETE